jgi:beta-glucanase (GH16 family)
MVVAKKGALLAPSREWRFKMRIREPLGIGVLLLGAFLCGCGSGGGGGCSGNCGTPPVLPAPTFSPAPGAYSSAQNVTLADSTAGAAIYYTTDGTTPTTGSKLYSSAIAVSSTTTISAMATASGYSNSAVVQGVYTFAAPAAEPTFTTTPAQNGAEVVSLASATAGATIYYTLDGSAPTTSSQQYLAPFLVASNLTVNAISTAPGAAASSVATQPFAANIPSGTLVWSDEFTNSTNADAEPNPVTWTYDTGNSGFGNSELEDYCAWGSNASPCSTASPNAYVGTDGYLHIVAEQPSAGVYTSARMKSEGLFSFQYGRLEARLMVPESQGMWPAFWLLGNNITTINWPSCGEADVMEHIDGDDTPFGGPGSGAAPGYDWTQSSVHGNGLNGGTPYTTAGFSAAAWHTYGMIWSKGQIQYYVDDPTNPYETFDASNMGGTWPFDQGPQFIILNLAVGGSWPGDPNSGTPFPSEMVVDYVRIYAN